MKGEAAFFGLRTLMCKKSMACLAYGTERPLSLMTASSWAEGCEIPRRSDRRLQIEPIFRGMSPLPGGLGPSVVWQYSVVRRFAMEAAGQGSVSSGSVRRNPVLRPWLFLESLV